MSRGGKKQQKEQQKSATGLCVDHIY